MDFSERRLSLRLVFCVSVLAAVILPHATAAQDAKVRPLATEAEKRAAIDETLARLCRIIYDRPNQKSIPVSPDCQNILAVDKYKGDKKSMKRYCADKRTGVDLCEIAQTTAINLSRELPKRIDGQSSLTEVSARGKALTVTYTFNVSGSQFRGFYTSAFQSERETNKSLSGLMRQRLCSNAALRNLINSGLQMTSIYVSTDKKLIGSAEVSACS